MKHTKGPWTHGFSHSYHAAEISTEGNTKRIALVDCNTFENCEANAALIAAAPEMLEALEVILSLLQSPEEADLKNGNKALLYFIEEADIDQIKAAIGKAKGQE